MNARSLLMALALALIGVAVFLLLRGDETAEGENGGDEKTGTSQSISRGGREADEEVRQGRRAPRARREKPAIVTTNSGLQYEVLVKGEGERPGPTSKVTVHYVGTLEDGTVFDSSRERGAPAEFPLNAVIKGWTEGLQLMRPGAQFRFIIPPELGYGSRAAGDSIPGNSTLIFEVELLAVEEE